MTEKRDFKGVWIPKEIWLEHNMTWMEKLFFTEIDSLDNKKGCYASNAYFAQFFNLKITRVSNIINSLIKKGYIGAKYERKGREIVKRVLTVNCNNVFGKVYEGIRNSVTRYSQYCKENNTSNNTSNNKKATPNTSELFNSVKDLFTSINSNYYHDGKEAKFVSNIIKRLKDFESIKTLVMKFKTITEKEKQGFWNNQPLIPSAFYTHLPKIEAYKINKEKSITQMMDEANG